MTNVSNIPKQPDNVENELQALADMSVVDLRIFWRERRRGEPPKVQSADLLRRLIAWEIQVGTLGDLPKKALRKIEAFDQKISRDKPLSPPAGALLADGTELTRDWRGTRHTVKVVGGAFLLDGKTYPTLSAVARAISGTRWSGPRFFGLERPRMARSKFTPDVSPHSSIAEALANEGQVRA